jgi:allantoate deiminase
VKDAGKYDGALGIIVGIAALKALVLDSFTEEAPVPCSLQLVAFSDEEGVRFSSTFLGSRALVGTLPYTVIKARDEEGHTFLEVLRHNGFKGTLDSIKTANISDALSSYVEVHIEQGPVLQQRKQFASPVVGISGQTRLLFTVHGTQGHAGTVPMTERKDALAASANIIHTIEKYCRQTVLNASEDTLLVCTVGDVRVWPGSSNVIPSTTNFTVDI